MTFSAFAEVVIDRHDLKPLDYGIPAELLSKIRLGIRVSIPLRGKVKKGTIVALKEKSAFAKVSPITDLLKNEEVLSPDLFKLAEWMVDYYCCPMSRALQTMLPSSVRKDMQEKRQILIESALSGPKLIEACEALRQKSPKQAEVCDIVLLNPKGILLSELLEHPKITRSPIDTLVKKGILKEKELFVDRSLLEEEFFAVPPKNLNDEQTKALISIEESLEKGSFLTHLIYGITGSGKTEIYMRAMEKALSLGKQVILLVPEIALTTQTIERLKGRFQERIAILHHRLSDGERHDAWHAIRKKEISIIVGARSAVFCPAVDLGLIIVDEEQETSYKQTEEAPCYHARDIAVMRGKLNNATVVLGSATPSIESFYNAKMGKYTLHLLTKRAVAVHIPEISLVNMKFEYDKAKGFTLFSDELLQKIGEKTALGEQVLLFLNRRGYFSSQVCKECKKAVMCKHCDISLTYHRSKNLLACHLCNYTLPGPIDICPSCKKSEVLNYQGPGTEQIERALHAIFPGIRTLRMDRDTTKHKGSHDRIFKQFKAGKADVLIGTQMIAKGLDFPSVTLVGILSADSGLFIPDFRSNEYVFQLLTQVAGRSGRGLIPGEVVIQSIDPTHPVMQFAKTQDYTAFYNEEIKEREQFGYPPFSRLAKLIFSGRDPEKVNAFATKYRDSLRPLLPKNFDLFPVTPCLHTKIKDNHRFSLLIKGPSISPIAAALKKTPCKPPSSIHLLVDINPTSLAR